LLNTSAGNASSFVLYLEQQVLETRVNVIIAFIYQRIFKIKHTMNSNNNAETGALETHKK
jgi:hypothetical protein